MNTNVAKTRPSASQPEDGATAPFSVLDPRLQTFGIEDLAKLMGKAVSTIKKDLSVNPERIPPRLKIPGSNRYVWRASTVIKWFDDLEAGVIYWAPSYYLNRHLVEQNQLDACTLSYSELLSVTADCDTIVTL